MLLGGASTLITIQPARAAEWEPFPTTQFVNDFGGVGLIQTPTARFAEDGQAFVGASRVWPYERYFVTVQATPWLEATLRYSSVSNRLYSPFPEFSGDQSYKDRGLDAKIKLLGEGEIRPALAIGARDFLGTGLFSSEYIVLSKEIGPFDASFGIGWGNLGSRGHIKNPARLLSSRFRDRGEFTEGGGTLNNAYFKGERAAFFGGIRYDTPIKGLTAKVEYDPNNYQSEALGNRFRVSSPINAGLDYEAASWLHLGASFERGNRLGLKAVLTTNFHKRSRMPKFDPPAPALKPSTQSDTTPVSAASPSISAETSPVPSAPLSGNGTPDTLAPTPPMAPGADVDKAQLESALALQGSGVYAVDFNPNSAKVYVAQGRFRNITTGLGRIARAAFSVLPDRYQAVTVVFVEGGMETMAATVYRAELEKALQPGRGSTDELFVRTEFSEPLLDLESADFKGAAETDFPRFSYAIRPGLRTTLGRPEQFILYQLLARFHATVELDRGLFINGSIGVNLSDNFDKLRIPSDSVLPRVRSDIAKYLREGRTGITHLLAEYNFNIAPSLYGHVYGGLLEEMFGGVGGEVLYRPFDSNWALGFDINWVKQRDYDQLFSFRDYEVVTGHVSASYHLEGLELDTRVRAGRYLAKDWGATFELSRTFKSGITVGAFATFTDVSAAEFGEGRFDKGLYILVPLDLFYIRNTRAGVGLAWKPLIRDGGQQLYIRRPLIGTTGSATMYNMRRDWRHILD